MFFNQGCGKMIRCGLDFFITVKKTVDLAGNKMYN